MTLIKTWFADLEVQDRAIIGSHVCPPDLPSVVARLQEENYADFDKQYRGVFRQMAIQSHFVNAESEYVAILRAAAITRAKAQITRAFSQPDARITQLIDAIDDIDESINLLSERLAEWCGLEVEQVNQPSVVSAIAPGPSIRGPLAQELALSIGQLRELRQSIAGTIERKMHTTAPNVSNLAGELLGARLIARAGGLEALARMPSSKIQVMGASKALFKHLKYGSKPPKHGLIFQHPLVRGSLARNRGKIARAIASKIAIAARLDFYSKQTYPALMVQLERRINELQKPIRRDPL